MSKAKAERESLFRDLLDRRLPQILGIYLGACWAVVQFVDFLVNRYVLSPNLTEVAIVVLISFIPTIMLLAYFHGKPGRDRWTRMEKVGIPLNLVLTGTLVFFIFSGQELGAASKTVTVLDEQGNQIERVIPKSQFRKKVALFFFSNETGNSELDWLQYGFVTLLEFDFVQDLFMDIRSGYYGTAGIATPVYEKMKKAGFEKGIDLPLTLQKKIADELHLNYFASGSFSKKNDSFTMTVSLHETKNGKLISKNSFTGANVFQLVDEVSLKLKQDLEVPAKHLDEVNDLPVSEIFTNSIPAMKSYTAGLNATLFEQNWASAQKNLELAVKEDPSFAMGYVMLKLVYLFTNQNQKRAEVFGPLMQHLYKLPERFQLFVKSDYYFLKQDPEKQLSVIKMLVSLYPEDVLSRSILALFYQLRNRKDEALAEYKRILEIDPEQDEVVRAVGRFHKQRGEFDEALKYFKQYSEKFPNDIKSYQNIGGVYLTLGDYKQAKTYYEKVLLFEPENISTLATLAGIEALMGNFEQSLTQIQDALTLCKTAKDKFKVYKSIESYYEMRGQINKALEYMHLKLTELDKFSPPLLALSEKIDALEKYVVAGQKETAFAKARELEAQLSPPFNEAIPFGYLQIYIELGDAEKAEEAIAGADAYIKKFQFEINRPIVLNGQGRVHEIRGEFEQAIQSYQKQLELEPTEAKIHRNVGRCYRQLKDYKKAEEHLQKTLQRYPFSAKTLYELALVFSEDGETEKALQHLQKAVKIWENADADYKYATQAKEKLSALQS